MYLFIQLSIYLFIYLFIIFLGQEAGPNIYGQSWEG